MSDFELMQLGYSEGWATKQDIFDATALGILTAAEYETITGETYKAK